ncbi:MAG: TIGR03943 family protein [Clostridium sp.]
MKRINLEPILKIGILLGFLVFFLKIIISGDINLYVHPRITPFVIVSVLALALIIIFYIPQIFKVKTSKRRLVSYLIFIIPLVIGFSMNAQAMTSNMIKNDNLSISIPGIDASSTSKERVVIENSNFLEFIDDSVENYNKYKSKEIEISGFVYKDVNYQNNEFAIARFMMTCCSADMKIVGLKCIINNEITYTNDTWVKAIGTLELQNINGDNVTVLNIREIEEVNAPKNQYVYPY